MQPSDEIKIETKSAGDAVVASDVNEKLSGVGVTDVDNGYGEQVESVEVNEAGESREVAVVVVESPRSLEVFGPESVKTRTRTRKLSPLHEKAKVRGEGKGGASRDGGEVMEAGDGGGKVIDLNSKRQKIDKQQLFHLIKFAYMGRPIPIIAPVGRTFGAICDKSGARMMVEIRWQDPGKTRGTITYIDEGMISAHISQYLATQLCLQKGYEEISTYRSIEVEEIRRLICLEAPHYDMDSIPSTLERDEPGLCFHRLDFSVIRPSWLAEFDREVGDGSGGVRTTRQDKLAVISAGIANGDYPDTPVFNELMGRMSNSESVMAFIGSLLDDKANRAQCLFMYGEGGNGKGRLIKALGKIFEGAHTATSVADAASPFFKASLVGSKLVTFGECDDYKFPVSELMKNITGDDQHTINIKNRPQFVAKIRCRVVYAANVLPRIKRNESNMRRIIFTEVGPLSEGTEVISESVYDEMLWSEAQGWLSKCWAVYRAVCANHGAIPQKKEIMGELVDASEEIFHELFDKYFVIDDQRFIGVQQLDVDKLFKNEGVSHRLTYPFLEFVGLKYGIKNLSARRLKADGTQVFLKKRWGLCIRPEFTQNIGMAAPMRPVEMEGKDEEWRNHLRVFFGDAHSF